MRKRSMKDNTQTMHCNIRWTTTKRVVLIKSQLIFPHKLYQIREDENKTLFTFPDQIQALLWTHLFKGIFRDPLI